MHVRNVAAFILPFTLLGCGHSSPAAPSSTSIILNLAPGSYALTLTMSRSGEPVCRNGICTATSLCVGAGGPQTVTPFATVVRLERSRDAVTIRPEDPSATLRLDLHIAGNTVDGTASGEFRDGALQISIAGGDGRTPAVATGTVLAASVTGNIDGQVSTNGYACSNNGHTWAIAPL